MSVTDQIAARELNRYKPVPQYSALTSSTINYPLNKEGQGMDGLRDNMGDVVDMNEVMAKWLKPEGIAQEKGWTEAHVRRLCRNKRIRAIHIGTIWRIEPASMAAYQPQPKGRKPKHS
jgi:hypothetical protein